MMIYQISRFHELRKNRLCQPLSSPHRHPHSTLPSTILLFSLHHLNSRCASASPSYQPSRDNFRSKPEPPCSSRYSCSFWSAIYLLTSRSIVHALTSNRLVLPLIRIRLQHCPGILCLSTFSLSGTPQRMGIGEITSWKSCLKPPIAETIFGHVDD